MIISVINHSNIADEEVQTTLRAINRQIGEDFKPHWNLDATLRLEGRSQKSPNPIRPLDMRGDAVIYLWNEINVENALGYHEKNYRGIPHGFVFTELSKLLEENWSVTFSHEALEIIGDPEVNTMAAGPHPTQKHDVFYWYEMCDAVQAETYTIDDVEVSNFLLPLYFTSGEEKGGRNDFLSKSNGNGKTLRSFKMNPGGYVGFFNPLSNRHETYSMRGDSVAAKRLAIKNEITVARRGIRYKQLANPQQFERSGKNSSKLTKAA